ncbi:MAG: class III signal peptide-containing protein [Candidatus Micrarchaeia archaeon]
MVQMKNKGQGAFEYLLMLGGIVMIAVIVIVMVQSATSKANIAIAESEADYLRFIGESVRNALSWPIS